MAVIRLKVLLLLMWVAIPGLRCQERGPCQQETTPIQDTYLNVDGGGCLQQSKTPANLETACRFCEDNGGKLVDLRIFGERNLGLVLAPMNITMWIQFDCTARKRCLTFYPYGNVSCSEEYFYFCFHNKTDDEKCKAVQDTTPTVTPNTVDGSHAICLAVGIFTFLVIVLVGIAGVFIYRQL